MKFYVIFSETCCKKFMSHLG